MDKTLSIIIPTYNVEKYLKRCLDSLLFDETIINDIEVIIVNDGSTDSSLSIAKEYEQKYKCIKVIDKENGGHGSTINAGLKVATGKYFRVIDSDDWVNIDEFSRYVKDIKKLDVDIILTNFTREYVYNSEAVVYEYPKELKYNTIYNLKDFDYSILNNEYFYMATSTIKTNILKNMNFHLDENTFYVDMEYNIFPLKYLKTMIYLDYNIYRYFIGRPEQSISQGGFVKHRQDHEKVLKKLIEYYEKEELLDNTKEFIKKIILLVLDSHYIIYCYTPIDKQLRKSMKEEIRLFTNFLKEKSPSLYTSIYNKYLFIKANIDTNFIFACRKHNLFTRVAFVIQNRREK